MGDVLEVSFSSIDRSTSASLASRSRNNTRNLARVDSDSFVNISEVRKTLYGRQGPRYEARWRERKYIQISDRDSSEPITVHLRRRCGTVLSVRALRVHCLGEIYTSITNAYENISDLKRIMYSLSILIFNCDVCLSLSLFLVSDRLLKADENFKTALHKSISVRNMGERICHRILKRFLDWWKSQRDN